MKMYLVSLKLILFRKPNILRRRASRNYGLPTSHGKARLCPQPHFHFRSAPSNTKRYPNKQLIIPFCRSFLPKRPFHAKNKTTFLQKNHNTAFTKFTYFINSYEVGGKEICPYLYTSTTRSWSRDCLASLHTFFNAVLLLSSRQNKQKKNLEWKSVP